MTKHFIDLSDFKNKELREILDLAKKIKKFPNKYNQLLNHKYLGILFQKQSTRTRLSFNIGMQKAGGKVVEINDQSIGFGKREADEDIIRVISQYIDCLVIRNNDHAKLKKLAELNHLPIINGLSNYSHPCQILSDIFTIEENLGPIEKNTITWLGDINNVLISLLQASKIFNFKLQIASPKEVQNKNKKLIKNFINKKVSFYIDPKQALKNSNCVMTDVWSSMGSELSKNYIKIFKNYQVNEESMKQANKNAIFLHCLPAHRNEEVSSSVIDSNQSKVWEQAKNRMYVQQSILYFCMN